MVKPKSPTPASFCVYETVNRIWVIFSSNLELNTELKFVFVDQYLYALIPLCISLKDICVYINYCCLECLHALTNTHNTKAEAS